ncbi:MAG: ComEC/Rec2 family competence protein [Candidatus Berkelbacteria bacterium]|nr:ComEC/Rec2 family competence protein [Candidatus Berkelbacteria bacterium]
MKKTFMSKNGLLSGATLYFFASPTFLILLFIFGVVIGSQIFSSYIYLWILAAISVITIFALFLKKIKLGICLIILSFGLFYFAFFQWATIAPVQTGCQAAKISSNPKQSGGSLQFSAQFEKGGVAVINTNEAIDFGYGDKLKICVDKFATNSDNSYRHYLLSQYKTDTVVLNPKIEKTETGRGFLRALYNFAASVALKIRELNPGTEGILAKGLLLGGSQGFSDQFKQNLKLTGTTHLVAVSGYNVSILTITIFGFIRKYFSRRLAFILSSTMLVIFCLMTGATSSVLRASIMGAMFLISKAVGRRVSIFHFLVLAAFLMIILNPFVIWDLGFQLSFAATAGLVFLSTPLGNFLSSKTQIPAIKEGFLILSETVSAQIFALPILLGGFGMVSLISPITNLLILPLVPTSMGLIAASYFVSLISRYLGIFVAAISNILLEYFVFVINFFAKFKIAAASVNITSAWWSVLLYLLIVFLTAYFRRKIKIKIDERPGF